MEVTGMCGQKKNRRSTDEDYKKEGGLLVKPSVFREKRSHLVRLSILVQN